MSDPGFIHLRVHSAYSLSEGAIQVKSLAGLCQSMNMPAVAVTDTNNLFGAMEFSSEAAAAGVQPIIGCQLCVGREGSGGRDTDQLVLLVQDQAGYRNLLKLLSLAYLEGDAADDPQVSLEHLEAHGDGLIALTGGPAGAVGRLLAEGQGPAAEQALEGLAGAFPGRLYVELMRHGLAVEKTIEPGLIDLAYRHGLPLVATNEVFFATPDMFEAHDALICIAEGAYLSQTDRRRLTPQYYLKTAAEMRALFADLPEAVDNTVVIARRCAFMVRKVAPILPPYNVAPGRSEEDELRAQAEAGLEERLAALVFAEGMAAEEKERAARPYRERLEYELKVIVDMGYPGYFLIVADFIRWAKSHEIPVGPGRGSGAGSAVAWALTITDLDPLRFGLLFERFLNPERVSLPDFDIDFCQDRRDEVIRYVQDKYGRDHVAQIITFGKLQARAVLRDVGRVLEMPYGQVDRICKLVPNNPADPPTLNEAIAAEPQLAQMIEEDEAVERLVGMARRLEGLYRHASTHAAGVVIGDRPLDELIPLYRDPRSDMPVTGFSMKYVEAAGLVKFDFLGLKTLTVLAKAVEMLRQRDVVVDLSGLPLDDAVTFEMLGRADTTGVFQLESSGMQDVLGKLHLDSFEELIAVVALFRPGPMDNIPSYIRRKHGEEEIDYLYPTLEGILKETFGIMIYQEQVLQIAQELSGYTLGAADLLRKAMGKKIQSEMDQQRQTFVEGAVARDVPEGRASDIFDQVAKFAGYGFNKAHATSYALVAYQTAYLKANYPVEFMAATMTLDMHNTDKLYAFKEDLRNHHIRLLPPDINASDATFTVERLAGEDQTLAIRYGLAAIKNVGEAAMKTVVAERRAGGPYKDLFDFAGRLEARTINKRQMEGLVRAGAFDGIDANRRRVFESIEILLKHAQAAANERDSNQMGLFGGETAPAPQSPRLPQCPDWPRMERLKEESEAIGFHLSGHPLDGYRNVDAVPSAEFMRQGKPGPVKLMGTVIDKRERTSGRGNRYAFIVLSDTSGKFEVTAFSEVLTASRDLLEPGNSVYLRASATFEGAQARFTLHSVEPLDQVAAKSGHRVLVVAGEGDPSPALKRALNRKGGGQVRVALPLGDGTEAVIDLKDGYAVTPDVIRDLKDSPQVAGVMEA